MSNLKYPLEMIDLAELDEFELDSFAGGGPEGSNMVGTFGCCWCVPWYSGWTKCGLVCNGKC